MVKWKYCAIKTDLGEKPETKLKYFDPTKNHTVTNVEDTHQTIAKLGEEGWELVTLTEINKGTARVYYFKKQE